MVIKKTRRESDFAYSAEQVWSAACAAYRINGGYRKYPEVVDGQIVAPANRDLVRRYLTDSSDSAVTAKDREQGSRCRRVLANSVTMRALRGGTLTEWDTIVTQMVELETVTTDYELSVISAMPKSYNQTLLQEHTDNRLAHCDQHPVGRVGESVTLQGEIVRCNYSNRFNTFYVTVITDGNQQVFFAYRERLEVGQHIRFGGRVKRHADSATQLSRVKLIEQEAV